MRDALPKSGEFIPTGKLGIPEDMGPIAVFLASEASDYMNGETITLDGGGLAGGLAPTGHAPRHTAGPGIVLCQSRIRGPNTSSSNSPQWRMGRVLFPYTGEGWNEGEAARQDPS